VNTTDPITDASPFEVRAEEVLARTFRGIHHCGPIYKHKTHWVTNKYGGMSTYDFDELTRLVFAAHRFCIRVEVKSSGPGMVKIVLTNRVRDKEALTYDKHPTIYEALESAPWAK